MKCEKGRKKGENKVINNERRNDSIKKTKKNEGRVREIK
jgi:hypothetical protein